MIHEARERNPVVVDENSWQESDQELLHNNNSIKKRTFKQFLLQPVIGTRILLNFCESDTLLQEIVLPSYGWLWQ